MGERYWCYFEEWFVDGVMIFDNLNIEFNEMDFLWECDVNDWLLIFVVMKFVEMLEIGGEWSMIWIFDIVSGLVIFSMIFVYCFSDVKIMMFDMLVCFV